MPDAKLTALPVIIAPPASSVADSIDAPTPWPIAISTFKREYTVRGGKWVKRQDLQEARAQETIQRLAKEWNMQLPITIQEAATLKSHAHLVLKDLNSLLAQKGVSAKLRNEVMAVKAELTKNWADLVDMVDNQPPDEGADEKPTKDPTEESGAPVTTSPVEENAPADKEVEEDVIEEATTMKKGSENYPSTDFLVVEDPKSPTTWHLQVKKHGKMDHGLMGGAWAALHGGYRGNKYEGPNKAAALTKLKAMYKEEKMPEPLSEVAIGLNTLTSMVSDAFRKQWSDNFSKYETPGPQSYPYPSSPWVKEVFIEHPTLGSSLICEWNGLLYMVTFDMDPATGVTFAPRAEWQTVVQTYIPVSAPAAESEPVREAEIEYLEEEALVENLSEDSEEIKFVELDEAETGGEVNDTVPLRMNVAFVYPGFGNKRDGHYYPAATLKRDAVKFKGLKMYESDHRASEKSTRTWVSTIEDMAGFTPEGAPIAKVVVHEPNFARRVRALSAAGQLQKLECSILANGKARKGKVDGREAKIVEEITDAESVDWVTRAGAGGKALQLSETGQNTEKEVSMAGQDGGQEKPVAKTPDPAPVTPPEPVKPAESEQPVVLAEADVLVELGKVRIPEVTKAKLAKGSYTTVEELNKAVEAEVAYLKEVTASGKPFEQNGQSPVTDTKLSEAEYEKKMAAIGSKYGVGLYHKEVTDAN